MHTRLDGTLGRTLVNVMLAGQEVRLRAGRLLADAPRRARGNRLARTVDDIPPAPLDTTRFQSHASFGERLMLEAEWRAWPGPSPELEIADVPDESRPASRACRRPSRASTTWMPPASAIPAALVTTYLPHQSDAWRHSLDDLSRFFDTAMTTDPPAGDPDRLHRPGSRSPPAGVGEALGTFAQPCRGDWATARRAARGLRTGRQRHRLEPARRSTRTISTRLAERATAAWERAGRRLTSQPPPSDAAQGGRRCSSSRSHDRFLARCPGVARRPFRRACR